MGSQLQVPLWVQNHITLEELEEEVESFLISRLSVRRLCDSFNRKKGCVSIVCTVQISKRRARMWSTPPPNMRNESSVIGLQKARVQVWGASEERWSQANRREFPTSTRQRSQRSKAPLPSDLVPGVVTTTSQHKKVQHNILVITRGSLLWVWSGISGSPNNCL